MTEIKDSLYEHTNNLTTVSGQRVVEWFSGKELDTFRWGTWTGTGAAYSMNENGFRMITGAGQYAAANLGFDATSTSGSPNVVGQFAHNGSVMISVHKWVTAPAYINASSAGLFSTRRGDCAGNDFVSIATMLWSTNHALRTANGSGVQTTTASSVNAQSDTDWHTWKIETTSSNCTLAIDGVAEVTITANLPTTSLSPVYGIQNRDNNSAGTELAIRYCEAYNT
jgi:hypothetical protein